MPRWKNARSAAARPIVAAALALGLAGCLGETPERARILDARVVEEGGVAQLEVTQELRFSRGMRDALDAGIALRLVYDIVECDASVWQVLELRYVPLTRRYELQRLGETSARSFTRRSALLAALDRIRLPLQDAPAAVCEAQVTVALDLTSLPTPLRFPALLQRDQWRLVSPPTAWTRPSRA